MVRVSDKFSGFEGNPRVEYIAYFIFEDDDLVRRKTKLIYFMRSRAIKKFAVNFFDENKYIENRVVLSNACTKLGEDNRFIMFHKPVNRMAFVRVGEYSIVLLFRYVGKRPNVKQFMIDKMYTKWIKKR